MCVASDKQCPRVAVIGTGMAGLACAWQLSQGGAKVTVYEKQEQPGLGAHSVEVDGVVVDLPPRIFVEDYYINVLGLYRHTKVNIGPASITQTFWFTNRVPIYFRYFMVHLGFAVFPLTLRPSLLLSGKFWRIVTSILRFSRDIKRDMASGRIDTFTLGAYLDANGYTKDFVSDFFVPMFSVVCTCLPATLLQYPARTIAEFVVAQPFLHSHKTFRAYGDGCREVSQILLKDAHKVCCNVTVLSVTNSDRTGLPVVTLSDGSETEFDHVVIATQANQALTMLPTATEAERRHLSVIQYERSDIALHRDPALMPATTSLWSPMNIMVHAGDGADGMCTAWQNAIQPQLAGKADLFQTWNPLLPIDEDKLVVRTSMERSVVTCESLRMLETLHTIQGQRRLWFCGSYAAKGIPLLESACTSGLAVAEAITQTKRAFAQGPTVQEAPSPWGRLVLAGVAAAVTLGVCMHRRSL